MPSSVQRSRSERLRAKTRRCGASSSGRLGGLRDDGRAVSEVVGAILMFGIVSVLFTMSLLGFVGAKDAAQERVVELQAKSVAQRVAGVIISAAIFHEDHPGAGPDMEFHRHIQVEGQIENRDYRVDLDNDTVTVTVNQFDISSSAPLLGANETAGLTVCDQGPLLNSGALLVKVSSTMPADCYWDTDGGLVPTTDPKAVFVEVRD